VCSEDIHVLQGCCAQGVPVAVAGGLAGCAFWTAALPADVVKTKIQSDISKRTTSTLSTVMAIAGQQGGNPKPLAHKLHTLAGAEGERALVKMPSPLTRICTMVT